MKRLRILTGRHVGASLDLPPGTHRLGPDGDCDITISDWTFAPLRLHVGSGSHGDDGVMAEWSPRQSADDAAEGTAAAPAQWRKLADFEPREFDGTVLCVGPAKGTWPSDVTLLDTVFQPTPGRVARWAGARLRTRRMAAVGGTVALVLGVLVSVVVAGGRRPPEPAVPTLQEAQAALQAELERLAPAALHVRLEQSTLVITGMVDTLEQANAACAAIQARRGTYAALPRFTQASEIAEAIRGTVGLPNATVRHLGDGVFTYVAEAADERAARAAIDRVTTDLAPAVKRNDATFEQVEGGEAGGPILSRFTADGISVVQTRDGVKHLVVKPSVSVHDALTLSNPPFGSQSGASPIPSKE
jgi:type III secretion protein D